MPKVRAFGRGVDNKLKGGSEKAEAKLDTIHAIDFIAVRFFLHRY